MARELDSKVDEAIVAATLSLLSEDGFGAMTVEAVAARAGVGKPAIYRRFEGKAALVEAAIAQQLSELDVPDLGDTRAEIWRAVEIGFPADGAAYVRLIGGLIAEEGRHPELMQAFRDNILTPRRAIVQGLVERGQARGDIGDAVDPVAAVDTLAGPLLARVFAGVNTGPAWRRRNFESWWEAIRERKNE